MRKGLPKDIAKKYGISKKAWAVFRGRKGKTSSRVSNPKTRRMKRTMARRGRWRGRRRGRGGFTLPIAPIAGLAAGLYGPAVAAMQGNYIAAGDQLISNYTGIGGAISQPGRADWKVERLIAGIGPLVIGCMVHKFVGGPPLNLNAMLARARVPIIRI